MSMLSRQVIYRSKTADYSLAATVIADAESINPLGVERRQVPPLTGEGHVHLTVFTPGLPPVLTPSRTALIIDTRLPLGSRILPLNEALDSIGDEMADLEEGQFIGMGQFGSTYAEYDIPFWRRPALLVSLPEDRAIQTIMRGTTVVPPGGWDLASQPRGTWTLP